MGLESLAGRCVLVTGGGGSIGSVLVKELLKYNVRKVKAFDIDEYSLSKLAADVKRGELETCLGDVKIPSDVELAVRGCDTVVHLAAVKMVDVSSYCPIPCIRTNVNGTINVITEALRQKIGKFLFVSSDKAVDFAGVYGATKFTGERLTLWANSFGSGVFSVTRLGNVIESRGNVFEIWREQRSRGLPITVTHEAMERFFWHVEEAVGFILRVLQTMEGGNIYVPKMPKYKIMDLAKEYHENIEIVGIRPEEKLDATIFTEDEKKRVIELKDCYVIKPT